jgi:hypothetical protein
MSSQGDVLCHTETGMKYAITPKVTPIPKYIRCRVAWCHSSPNLASDRLIDAEEIAISPIEMSVKVNTSKVAPA